MNADRYTFEATEQKAIGLEALLKRFGIKVCVGSDLEAGALKRVRDSRLIMPRFTSSDATASVSRYDSPWPLPHGLSYEN